MFQKLPLYVLKYFLKYFVFSTLIFIFLFFIASFIQIVNEEGVMNGFSFYLLFKSLAFLVPNILSISIPFSLIMSIMLTIGQLSINGELIAIKAGGYSYYDMTKYILFISLFLCLFLILSNNYFAPYGIKKSRENVRKMFTRMTNIYFDSGTFTTISEWDIYPRRIYGNKKIEGIVLTRRIGKKGNTSPSIISILADKGDYEIVKEKGIKVNLSNGNFSRFDMEDSSVYWWGNFEKYSTFIPFKINDEKIRTPNPKELTTPEMFKIIFSDFYDEVYIFLCKQELYMRFAFALVPIAFFIIACALGFIFDRESKSFGFFMSILVIFIYYGLMIFSKFFTEKYKWSFPWLIFVPFLLTFFSGLYLWKGKLGRR